jgi:hypothetical protein
MKASEERFHRHKKHERWRRGLSAQADPSTPLKTGSFTGVKGKAEKSLRGSRPGRDKFRPEVEREVEGRDGRLRQSSRQEPGQAPLRPPREQSKMASSRPGRGKRHRHLGAPGRPSKARSSRQC